MHYMKLNKYREHVFRPVIFLVRMVVGHKVAYTWKLSAYS